MALVLAVTGCVAAAGGVGGSAAARGVGPASFDCARAGSFAERAICADQLLASLDRGIDWTYRRLLAHLEPAGREAARADQRRWLATRDACADADCLKTEVMARDRALFGRLDARDAELRAGVRRVGDCQVTTIDHLGSRFSEDTGPNAMGTTVGFANGVWQVDYDRVAPALASRIGDPARVCLASIPRHCPPGDARGRVYVAVNLRTHLRWRMYDSQHLCGGA